MYTQITFQLLRGMVQKDPGTLTGAIAYVLGVLMNWIYDGIYYLFGENNSLGLTIIFFTLVARILMTPLAYKQQKSMYIMRKIQPEITKLQQKYSTASKDPEVQKKLAAETQKIYAKHKYNPFGGCLPLIIQLPIFFALYYIMQNAFLYIHHISDVYNNIANIIISNADQSFFDNVLKDITLSKVPASLQANFHVLTNPSDLCKLLNKIDVGQWKAIVDALPDSVSAQLDKLYAQQTAIESFLGVRMTERVGFDIGNLFTNFTDVKNLKLLIPILSGFTTWFSSYLMTSKNSVDNQQLAQQQRIMNIVMPLMMAWITVSLPAGVGLYWIVGNIFMVIQQQFFNVYFDRLAKKDNAKEERK